jgi:hypothetical protein
MITINKRFWRIALAAIICILLLVIISIAFIGFQPWVKYTQILPIITNNFGKYGFYPEIQNTVRGLLTRILGYSESYLINSISIYALILGMGLTIFLWFHNIQTKSPMFKLYFAFIIMLTIFLNLHLYDHDDLLLIFPIALFYDYLRQMNFPKRGYTILIIASPLIFFIAVFCNLSLFNTRFLPFILIVLLLDWMSKYLILDYRNDHLTRRNV